MNCCNNCFKSNYLSKIILSDSRMGNCDFCSSKNVAIYSPKELIPFFRNIFSRYEVNNETGIDFYDAINEDFKDLILNADVLDPRKLLLAIIENDTEEFQELFDNKVISKLNKEQHLQQSQAIHSVWENFKNEIKNINRFHISNTIDLSKLGRFFENEAFINYSHKGKIFFRSRISSKIGFEKEEMGNPPPEKASAGRANPRGISYLYLADSVKTSMYETRSSLFDYVTVGEFRLKEDIRILNLCSPIYDPISWSENEAVDDYLIFVPFIQTLQTELALPIRRLDKDIDYLPTQYLSEFIKSIGFDGVKFQSSLNASGYNLTIFSVEKFECVKVDVYEIESIQFDYKEVLS
ncbi:RES domain-containing protein [Fluviicola taffensis]|uniref:RES domain-containing protein n=1 Tax=Fluviicola taffensis TaxID=191579 RepID=UPI003137F6A0